MPMRRAKIIATIGPASSDAATIKELLDAGMDVARLNFSHGKPEDHAEILDRIRAAGRQLRRAVGVLQDLQGPKIRTGPLKAGKKGVMLQDGAEITITTEGEQKGDEKLISTTYKHLAEDVRPGDRLLLDDGLLELKVLDTDGVRVRCEVIEGGALGESKGINLPGVNVRAEALSEKDKKDLAFGLAHGVDFVALSFVRSPDDVLQCRAEMEKSGRFAPIIAKIEKPEAVARLDAILAVADGLMVARGDLGVEIAPERVPGIQKDIVRRGNKAGKPVIIATQMLNSMIEHPRPTRAEASDVANAVWDGADALMLSGETASGKNPLESLQMMDRIIREAEEQQMAMERRGVGEPPVIPAPFNTVVAGVGCRAAREIGASVICCFTLGGTTARLLANYRPRTPIVAFSPDQAIRRRLALYWGVNAKVMEPVKNPDIMADMVAERLIADGAAKPGDKLVIVFGAPISIAGQTNSIRLHEIPVEPASST
jgi:pyruvate kinase